MGVGCTKSQLLALITRIMRDIENCRSIECAKAVVRNYKQLVEEQALTEIWREIVSP